MPYFNRFDICEAYSIIADQYNVSGYTTGRHERRHGETNSDINVRLHRIGFRPRPSLDGFIRNLTPNGLAIYTAVATRLNGEGA